MNEAIVEINGVRLDVGQSMTLRVAIASFLAGMQDNGLGNDATGKAMAEAYIARASEVEQLLTRPYAEVRGVPNPKVYGPRGQCRVHGCEDPAKTPDGLCSGHFY